jgi:DNA topoisomerase-3
LQTLYRETLFNYEDGRFLKKKTDKLADKVNKVTLKLLLSKKRMVMNLSKTFDLTGLQVYCNTKFGFSADETLKNCTNTERKVVTYPRVDTTFLPNDIYPKVQGILQNLTNYPN